MAIDYVHGNPAKEIWQNLPKCPYVDCKYHCLYITNSVNVVSSDTIEKVWQIYLLLFIYMYVVLLYWYVIRLLHFSIVLVVA